MEKANVRSRILEIGIVPVVRASSAREAMMAVDAISLGGIPVAEIAASDSISDHGPRLAVIREECSLAERLIFGLVLHILTAARED